MLGLGPAAVVPAGAPAAPPAPGRCEALSASISSAYRNTFYHEDGTTVHKSNTVGTILAGATVIGTVTVVSTTAPLWGAITLIGGSIVTLSTYYIARHIEFQNL